MTSVSGEPAEVWLVDGLPVRFVWRGRLYSVLSIVSRPPAGAADDQAVGWQCWHVQAAPGRNIPSAPFELCYDPPRDRWHLTRLTAR